MSLGKDIAGRLFDIRCGLNAAVDIYTCGEDIESSQLLDVMICINLKRSVTLTKIKQSGSGFFVSRGVRATLPLVFPETSPSC
jgi:hypothetical protein